MHSICYLVKRATKFSLLYKCQLRKHVTCIIHMMCMCISLLFIMYIYMYIHTNDSNVHVHVSHKVHSTCVTCISLVSTQAYPSLKPLASWVKDLVERIQFIQRWIDQGIPPVI